MDDFSNKAESGGLTLKKLLEAHKMLSECMSPCLMCERDYPEYLMTHWVFKDQETAIELCETCSKNMDRLKEVL